jgi:hypothetical protein
LLILLHEVPKFLNVLTGVIDFTRRDTDTANGLIGGIFPEGVSMDVQYIAYLFDAILASWFQCRQYSYHTAVGVKM